VEHLEAAQMVLKAGIACILKDGEECENTAIAVERVAGDMIGLSTAVAVALNRVLKEDDWKEQIKHSSRDGVNSTQKNCFHKRGLW
jgi:gamma-glutamyl phosphate reductase